MIEAEALSHAGLSHGFFTRQGGVSSGIYGSLNGGLGSNDDRASVLENRSRMAARLGVDPGRLVSPYQIHSPDVIAVEKPFENGADRRADALVTRTPGLALAVSTADCGPVLFADPKAGVIGAAHAGWRGAFGGVLENTVDAMVALGAAKGDIVAVLGPTISQASYEVGAEFQDRFVEADAGNSVYFTVSAKPGHYMFDLPAYALGRLSGLGLAHAGSLGLCTYLDEERFYSYRRATHRGEPDYGRLISAIVLT